MLKLQSVAQRYYVFSEAICLRLWAVKSQVPFLLPLSLSVCLTLFPAFSVNTKWKIVARKLVGYPSRIPMIERISTEFVCIFMLPGLQLAHGLGRFRYLTNDSSNLFCYFCGACAFSLLGDFFRVVFLT